MEPKEIEYDPETNLPKLPDGLFWKIKARRSGYVSIEIVREVTNPKHTFFGFKWGYETEHSTVEDLYTYLKEDELSDENIRETAEDLYTSLVNLEVKKSRIDEIVGIYPPKKL